MFRMVVGAALTLGVTAHSVNAQVASEDARMVLANFIFETMECVSFYSILGSMENNAPEWENLSGNYIKLTEDLFITALNLADSIQLDKNVLILKAQQYTDEMGQMIRYDAINISLLLEEYGASCKELVEDPELRLNYWIEKEK